LAQIKVSEIGPVVLLGPAIDIVASLKVRALFGILEKRIYIPSPQVVSCFYSFEYYLFGKESRTRTQLKLFRSVNLRSEKHQRRDLVQP
jgi:hypothetical protein